MVDKDQYLGYFRKVGRSAAALGIVALSCGDSSPAGQFNIALENDKFRIVRLSPHSYTLFGKGSYGDAQRDNSNKALEFIRERCQVERTRALNSTGSLEVIVTDADCVPELRQFANTQVR